MRPARPRSFLSLFMTEPATTRPTVGSPLFVRRGFTTFACLGFAASSVTLGAFRLWSRSAFVAPGATDRVVMIGLIPVLSVLLTMTISIAVGALGARAACAAFGRLPAPSLLLMLPICGFAMWLQMAILLPADWSESSNKFGVVERCVLFQIPMLFVFWAWARKPIRPSLAASSDVSDLGWHPDDPA